MARTAEPKKFHFGEWLKDRIADSGIPVKVFAAKLGVAESTVHNWFAKPGPNIRAFMITPIARELKMPREVLAIHLENGRHGVPISDAQRNFELGSISAAITIDENLKTHRIVTGGSAMPAAFNLGIAAGGWIELAGEGRSPNPRQWRAGWLIVRISGDSMQPRWEDGQHVLFHTLNLDEDQPQIGTDYFVIRNDGTGTFKRLAAVDREQFSLRALNTKYKKDLHVGVQEIVMMAEARFIVSEPPDH